MRAVTLQPAAGAQGELTGILMIRAYHRARGDMERDEVLVPDSLARHEPGDRLDGRLQDDHDPVGARRRRRPRRVPGGARAADRRGDDHQPVDARACSRRGSASCSSAVHAAGALAYMDGANLNAILGRFKPGEAGFDVMHFNSHKTFSTPHGGGGPGAGPVGVGETLAAVPAGAARPARATTARSGSSGPASGPTSIGRLRSFVGSTGVLVRAYAYHPRARRHGPAPRSATTRSSPRTTSSARVGEAVRHPVRPAVQARVRRVGRRHQEARPASGRSTSPSGSSTTASTRRRSTSR